MALIICKNAHFVERRGKKTKKIRVLEATGCVNVTKTKGKQRIGRIRLVVRKDLPK